MAIAMLFLNIGGAYAYIKFSIASTKRTLSSLQKELALDKLEISHLNKFKDEKTPLLVHFSKNENILERKIDKLNEELIELRVESRYVLSLKEARKEFVSIDVFRRVEEHLKTIEALIKER